MMKDRNEALDDFLSGRIGHPVHVRYFFAWEINDKKREAQLAFRTTKDEYYALKIGQKNSLDHMISFDQLDVHVPDRHLKRDDYIKLLGALPAYNEHHETYDSCHYFFIKSLLQYSREPGYIGRYRPSRAFETSCYVVQNIHMKENGYRMTVTYRDLTGDHTQSKDYVFTDPLIFTNQSLRNVAIVKYLLHYHPHQAPQMYRKVAYLGDDIELMDGGNLIPVKHPQVLHDIWDHLAEMAS